MTKDRLTLAAADYVEAMRLHAKVYDDERELGHYDGERLTHGHERGVCPVMDAALADVLADNTPHSMHDAYWELVGAVEEAQARIEGGSDHKPHPPKVRP